MHLNPEELDLVGQSCQRLSTVAQSDGMARETEQEKKQEKKPEKTVIKRTVQVRKGGSSSPSTNRMMERPTVRSTTSGGGKRSRGVQSNVDFLFPNHHVPRDDDWYNNQWQNMQLMLQALSSHLNSRVRNSGWNDVISKKKNIEGRTANNWSGSVLCLSQVEFPEWSSLSDDDKARFFEEHVHDASLIHDHAGPIAFGHGNLGCLPRSDIKLSETPKSFLHRILLSYGMYVVQEGVNANHVASARNNFGCLLMYAKSLEVIIVLPPDFMCEAWVSRVGGVHPGVLMTWCSRIREGVTRLPVKACTKLFGEERAPKICVKDPDHRRHSGSNYGSNDDDNGGEQSNKKSKSST